MSKQIAGFIVIAVSDNGLEKAKTFVENWNAGGAPVKAHEVVVTYKGQRVEMTLGEFLETLGIFSNPCPTCHGDGEVSKMEPVYPGEPHMADIGTEICPDCHGAGREGANHDE